MSGNLFVVATPIGNMGDISERARSVLESADLILAEDSRVSASLLARLGIKARIASYHKFTEVRELEKHIEELLEGKNIAMISDAGTPAVSDPGKYLVRAALERGIRVTPVPGANAAVSAFSCSGSMENSFVFCGFLPSKGAERAAKCNEFLSFGLPVVFYESPMRIRELLEMLAPACERVVVSRELTKQFEEIFVWNGGEVKEKGEFTVVAEPKKIDAEPTIVDSKLLELLKNSNLSVRDSTEMISRLYPNMKSNEIKKLFMSSKNK